MSIDIHGAAPTAPPRRGMDLVDEALFGRLCRRIVLDHGRDEETSKRIMDQALAFLAACAVSTTPLSPSEEVDIGWHTFILYTREYAAFCERVAGRFIHHLPDDDPQEPVGAAPSHDSAEAIAQAGFAIDAKLWAHTADCGGCGGGGGCGGDSGDSGGPGCGGTSQPARPTRPRPEDE